MHSAYSSGPIFPRSRPTLPATRTATVVCRIAKYETSSGFSYVRSQCLFRHRNTENTSWLSSKSSLSLLKSPKIVSKRMWGSNHNLGPLFLCLYLPEVQFQTTIKHCVLLPRLENCTAQHKITLSVYLSYRCGATSSWLLWPLDRRFWP